jgi:hypothetical protein
VFERIKIISKGIDDDSIFRCWVKSKNMSIKWPKDDIRKELKLNIFTLVPSNKGGFKVEAEMDLRTFNPKFVRGLSDIFSFQINVSYKINEDILLIIGTRRKFCDRIKVHIKERSRRANGLILKIKKTDVFFLPIDMTKAYYDHEHYQFNYIAGVYSEKFYSYDNYELDLFGLTKKRADMSNSTAPHCLTGGVKLAVSYKELKYAERLNQALRLTYQYHKRHAQAYTNHNLQWEAKLTNRLKYGSSNKLDVNLYIASKAFQNVFEDKKPWPNLLDYYENMHGFYRPRCGIHTMLTKKLSEKLTFSLEAVLFFSNNN